ncbi:MAG: hypothetical protein L3K03_09650, partial [Thermoplasmata archaeon]|nr:hypothetical protein [Thermoplasmata archaeon]
AWEGYYPYYDYYCTAYNDPYECPSGDAAVQLSVSTNGGVSFNAPIQLPVNSTSGSDLWVASNPNVLVTPNGTVAVAYMSNLTFNGSLGLREPCEDEPQYNYDDCGAFLSDVMIAQSANNGTNWSLGVVATGVEDAQDTNPTVNYYEAPYEWGGESQYLSNAEDNALPAPKMTYDPVSQQIVMAYAADLNYHDCLAFYGGCESYLLNEMATPELYEANGSLANNSWTSRLITEWSGLANSTLTGVLDTYWYNPAIVSTADGTIYLSAQYVNGSLCAPVAAGASLFDSYEGAFNYCGEGLEVYGISTDNGSSFTLPGTVDPTGTWLESMSPGLQSTMVAAGNQVWIAWTQTICPNWNTTVPGVSCAMGEKYYFPVKEGYTSNTTVIVSRLYTGAGITITFQETGLPVSTTWSVDFSGDARTGLSGSSLSVSGVPAGANQSWSASIVTIGPGTRYFGTPNVVSPGNFTANTTITWTYVLQYTLTVSSIPNYPDGGASSGGETWFNGELYCDNEGGEYYFDPAGGGDCSYYTTYTSINYNLTPGPGTVWADAGTPFRIQAIPLNASQFWNSATGCIGCTFDYVNLTFQAWTGTGSGSYNGTANSTLITLNGPVTETASFGLNGYCLWEDAPAWTSNCAPSGLTVGFQETGLPSGVRWGVSVWSTGPNQSTPYPAFSTQTHLNVVDPALTSLAYFEAFTVPSSTPGDVWVPTADPASPLLGPLDGASILHYSLTSVDSASFTSTVRAMGLPNGTAWSYAVDGLGVGVGASYDNLTITGGSHSFSANPVYLDNGVGYQATAIDIQPFVINETWSNVSSSSTTYAFNGSASIT